MATIQSSVSCFFRDTTAELTVKGPPLEKNYSISRSEFAAGSGLAIAFMLHQVAKTFFDALYESFSSQDIEKVKQIFSSGMYHSAVYFCVIPIGFFGAFFPQTARDFLDVQNWNQSCTVEEI